MSRKHENPQNDEYGSIGDSPHSSKRSIRSKRGDKKSCGANTNYQRTKDNHERRFYEEGE